MSSPSDPPRKYPSQPPTAAAAIWIFAQIRSMEKSRMLFPPVC